ncbi:MAG: hypothetical protein N2C12_04960, partial [Planctomycetales bacterium]
ESTITVTSASGVLADQVAEHTVALVTASLRNLPRFFEAQKNHEFVRRPTRDLHRAKIGIVGFGGVGRRVAELLTPFRTRIVATDMFPKSEQDVDVWPASRLQELLSQSDIVILCAPLTDQTRGMINSEALSSMPTHGVLVNVARGQLVVESDLVEALQSGVISAAALDVTWDEPLPANSLLWDMPNVLITPHVAGQSARRIDEMTTFFCNNLVRYQRGDPLINVVDKQLGYPIPPHAKPG